MVSKRISGLSMVEVMISVVIANIGLAALVSTFSHYQKEEIESRAFTTALLSLKSTVEEIKASNFDTLLTQYNNTPGDDPNGEDKGGFFSVAGLTPPYIGGGAVNPGEIIIINEEAPDETAYGRDLGTNGLGYVDGKPDGKPDGIDLNLNGCRTDSNAFGGNFDLNLNGVKTDTSVLGLSQTSESNSYKSLRCIVRVSFEVMGQIHQLETQTQVTRAIK